MNRQADSPAFVSGMTFIGMGCDQERREMKQWMEVNGATLRYELGGEGPETVVLLHEGGGCIESWDEALPAFREHFRTLCYDQRGFGQSEKIRREFTYDMIVGDLAG